MSSLLLGLILAVCTAIVVAEVNGGLVALARRIIGAATRRLPRDRDRWREEWLSDLECKSERPLTALLYAMSVYRHAGSMVLALSPCPELSRAARALKRAMDVTIASAAIFVNAPLLVVLALSIKIESPGPVLFRQRRRGSEGRPFDVLKFRTARLAGPEPPRMTRIGRFLYRYSFDEVPKLFNVIRGEMSLIGPPLGAPEAYAGDQLVAERPNLKPGMTGPWQLGGLYASVGDMVESERQYVTNWSVWRDLRILLRILGAVFSVPPRQPPT